MKEQASYIYPNYLLGFGCVHLTCVCDMFCQYLLSLWCESVPQLQVKEAPLISNLYGDLVAYVVSSFYFIFKLNFITYFISFFKDLLLFVCVCVYV